MLRYWDGSTRSPANLHRAWPAQSGLTHSRRRCAGGRYLLWRGQLKLLMCALRLARGTNRESGGGCLPDRWFASELDDERRGLLASRLKATQSQVFVSAISAEHVMGHCGAKIRRCSVKGGK
ncbi:hypothetical protein ACLB1T_11640 [Escherichia coli]